MAEDTKEVKDQSETGSESSADNKSQSGEDQNKDSSEMVSVPKGEHEETVKKANNYESQKVALQNAEEENKTLKVSLEEAQKPKEKTEYDSETSQEDQQGIERDFKRLSKDFLADSKPYSDLNPAQRKEFNEEWDMRTSRVLKKAFKSNEYVAKSELVSAQERIMKAVVGVDLKAAEEKGRQKGQNDALNKEAGAVDNTTTVHKESVGEIDPQSYQIVEATMQFKEGKVKKGNQEYKDWAKRIQEKHDTGDPHYTW